ncbi:MAG: TlpA family protein disulfide reductase [Actinobacteria bacterium]|nr:TlpA family protein disulfide reductase [Actinomycetota bacterium]
MSARLRLAGQILAVGLVASLLALLVWKVAKEQGSGIPAAIRAGKSVTAPDFTLPRLDGSGELTLSTLRGQAVVLNFWASWCAPCEEEAPVLQSAWEEHRGEGVAFIGIASRDFDGDAKKFVRKYRVTYPNVHDGAAKMWVRYGVIRLPETFVIGRSGKLVGLMQGAIRDSQREEFEDLIDRALVS